MVYSNFGGYKVDTKSQRVVEITAEEAYKQYREIMELRTALSELVTSATKVEKKDIKMEDAIKRSTILLAFPFVKNPLDKIL